MPAVRTIVAVALLLACSPSLAERWRVAVLPVTGEAVPEQTRELLDAALRGEVRRLQETDMQASEETRRHLEGAFSLGLMCNAADPACAAELGTLCGVPRVVVAHASPRTGGVTLELALVEVTSSQVLATARTKVGADMAEVVPAVRTAVRRLLVPEAEVLATATADEGDDDASLWWGSTAALAGVGAALLGAGVLVALTTTDVGTAPLAPNESVQDRKDAINGVRAVVWTLYAVGGLAFVGAGTTTGLLVTDVVP